MTGNAGLFGPGSVTWTVHREPVLWLGGLRSLYLQALHPRAVAAVAQNSVYRSDPWGRLMRTSEYVGTVVYGTTEQALAAGERLRRIHARIGATDPVSGTPFRVDTPDLLRWVHVTEVESFLTSATRAGLRLTPAEIDRYYAEQVRAAELVGLDPAEVPATAQQVADYYEQVRPELAMTRDSAETAMFLTFPTVPGDWGNRALRLGLTLGPARWAYLGVASTAMAMLPPWARRLYGGLGWPTTDLTADLSLRSVRLVLSAFLRTLPDRYRYSPVYRAAMERAATEGPAMDGSTPEHARA